MTDVTVAPAAAPVAAPPPAIAEKAPPVAAPNNWSASDAARLLASRRTQKQEPAEPPPQAEPPAQELAVEANAAPQEIEATSETQEGDPAELPPLDLPRSWTKEQAEHWKALPRATQEYLSERASKDSAELRRVQNEAAEQRKAMEARADQMEKARQEYESKLPALMQLLETQNPFPEIRSVADLERITSQIRQFSTEDPFQALQLQARLQEWQTHQQKMAALKYEVDTAEQRKTQEKQVKTIERRTSETVKLIEKFPEFKDEKKLKAAQDAAVQFFMDDLGYTQSELADLGDNPLLDDHRFQGIVYDAMRWRDAQKAKTAVVAKPVPPVTRPGTPRATVNSNASRIQALEKELSTAPGHKQAQLMAQIRQLRKAG